MDIRYKNSPVLICANGRLSSSIPVCLLQAGHSVSLVTNDTRSAATDIYNHIRGLSGMGEEKIASGQLRITSVFDNTSQYALAIAITGEDAQEKKAILRQLEDHIPADSPIAINTESIPLSTLQQGCDHPARVIGVNWAEPAYTTFFLELIANDQTGKEPTNDLFRLAKACWNKDPYLVWNDVSVRAKMFSAMVREAFFLVQNGYASVEDIDKACRNDAGYYLPFSGNFRYMDLMGTYAYGLVMKDLNPELSKATSVPEFFKEIIRHGRLGMEYQEGFYAYEKDEAEHWRKLFSRFSYQIREIICKYPFNYRKRPVTGEKTAL